MPACVSTELAGARAPFAGSHTRPADVSMPPAVAPSRLRPPAARSPRTSCDAADAHPEAPAEPEAPAATAAPLRRGRSYAPPPSTATECRARGGEGGGALTQRVRVCVRLKPARTCARNAQRCARPSSSARAVAFCGGGSGPQAQSFGADAVLDEGASQAEAYAATAAGLVARALEGRNATLLAYGQTGSGKTHTVLGPPGSLAEAAKETVVSEQSGVGPRAVVALFEGLEKEEGGSSAGLKRASFRLRASFAEIYNENVADLLAVAPGEAGSDKGSETGSDSRESLVVREGKGGSVHVDGLTWVECATREDALAVLERGAASRRVGATKMNAQSSRSHAVFSLELRLEQEGGAPLTSLLRIVDLAGSERQRKADTAGEDLAEAGCINKSLSALSNVFRSLGTSGRAHIPFRDSKLTFLLKESLGGNCCTVLLANISTESADAAETLSTLQFAARCKLVRTASVVNVDESVGALKAEIARLRALLAAKDGLADAVCDDGAADVSDSDSEASVVGAAVPDNLGVLEASLSAALSGALRRERAVERERDLLRRELGTLCADEAAATGCAPKETPTLRAENGQLSVEEANALRSESVVLRERVLAALEPAQVAAADVACELEECRARVKELEADLVTAAEREESARLGAMDASAAELSQAEERATIAERLLVAREQELAQAMRALEHISPGHSKPATPSFQPPCSPLSDGEVNALAAGASTGNIITAMAETIDELRDEVKEESERADAAQARLSTVTARVDELEAFLRDQQIDLQRLNDARSPGWAW